MCTLALPWAASSHSNFPSYCPRIGASDLHLEGCVHNGDLGGGGCAARKWLESTSLLNTLFTNKTAELEEHHKRHAPQAPSEQTHVSTFTPSFC